MKKVGIFGGTFDPPHYGHLLMANEVLESLNLSEIWFMPNQIPPHKQNRPISSSEHRFNMLNLAIEGNDAFRVEPIELEREGPSYTYDTMVLLKKRYPHIEFYFIIGGDMIEFLPQWYKIDQLHNMIQFIGVKRPNFSVETDYPIVEVEVPQFDVSSSMIRHRFMEGKHARYLLPDSVIRYIKEHQLYES
ncbi:nicotinate-nucleotide adenylyltransferase [Bacillus sp. FJAT-47783]|uniref:nicotinate-nucleotide adenylyltransferase n=1 Tax=Bacillus sp. FJAT-47783 TaxID=2922712 RepID=UPI001FAE0E05